MALHFRNYMVYRYAYNIIQEVVSHCTVMGMSVYIGLYPYVMHGGEQLVDAVNTHIGNYTCMQVLCTSILPVVSS